MSGIAVPSSDMLLVALRDSLNARATESDQHSKNVGPFSELLASEVAAMREVARAITADNVTFAVEQDELENPQQAFVEVWYTCQDQRQGGFAFSRMQLLQLLSKSTHG